MEYSEENNNEKEEMMVDTPPEEDVSESESESESESDSEYGSEEEDEGTEDYCRGGYHPVNIGDHFKSEKTRYRIEKKLGWGHFSTVWLARDTDSDQLYALKIQKSAEDYTEAAFDEISLFKDVLKYSNGEDVPVVKFVDAFKHSGPHGLHICMVFELLSDNLYTLIQLYEYQGIPRPLLKRYAKQMLSGLDHLHRKCGIIHTDLKPENILLTAEHQLPKLYEGEPRPPPKPVVNYGVLSKSKKKRLRKKAKTMGGAQMKTSSNTPICEPKKKLTKNQKRRLRKKKKAVEKMDVVETNTTEEEMTDITEESQEVEEENETETKQGRRRIRYSQEVLDELAQKLEDSRVKISDLGNGCWIRKRFTDDITTHEYRSPEVILGATWGTPVDIWGLGCVMFEIATGDLLFKPKKCEDPDDSFDDNDDHLAQMMELMGKISRKFALSGKKSKRYFTRHGEMKNIDSLTYWGLEDIMKDKYGWSEEDAKPFADFLTRMLQLNPANRESAYQLLEHEWLAE